LLQKSTPANKKLMPKHLHAPAVKKLTTKKGLNALSLLEVIKKSVDDFTQEEIDELCVEFMVFMKDKETMWHKGFFAQKGIKWAKVEDLRKKFPVLNEVIEIAVSILEDRYVVTPFYKNTTSKHCMFLLERAIREGWTPQSNVSVDIQHHNDLFGSINAQPIIEVRERSSIERNIIESITFSEDRKLDEFNETIAMGPNEMTRPASVI
jgi:hypothetical protein